MKDGPAITLVVIASLAVVLVLAYSVLAFVLQP